MATDYLNEEIEQQLQEQFRHDRDSFFGPIGAGLGAIALGSIIFGTRLGQGGVISNLMHFLGRPRQIGLVVDKSLGQVARGQTKHSQRSIFSLIDRFIDSRSGRLQLDQLDIVRDTVHAIEMQRFGGQFLHERLVETMHRRFANRPAGFFSNKLERVTLREVLADQDNIWTNVLGHKQHAHLKQGRAMGLLSDEMILDPRIYKNRFGEIRDLREPRRKLGRLLDSVDLFGQKKVFQSLIGEDVPFAVLSPVVQEGKKYPRVFVGGTVYRLGRHEITGEMSGVVEATGRKLREMVGLGGGGAPGLRAIHEAREGTLQFAKGTGFLDRVQDKLGIGRKFRTRHSLFDRMVINPILRLRALDRGEAVVYRGAFRAKGARKMLDAVVGDEIPELLDREKHLLRVAGGGRAVEFRELNFRQRLGVTFGLSDELHVIKRGRFLESQETGRSLIGDDLLIRRPTGSLRSVNDRYSLPPYITDKMPRLHRSRLTAAGDLSSSVAPQFYDVQKGFLPSLREFVNYTTYRVNNLASESFLGIGFKPSGNIFANLGRLALIPFAYEVGRQYLLYADYLLDKNLGISPIKGLASLYTGLRVAQQDVREATGIQQAAEFLEDKFPGSINSGLGFLARSALAPAAVFSMLASRGGLIRAALGGLGTYAVIGGPKPDQPAQELAEEYAGERKVPIREGRFWGLGYTPFEGGRVVRYGYSWYHKLVSDYKTKSIYGSADEYYGHHFNAYGIPLPGFHNLFGLSNLVDPYRLERMHYYDRPYPVTGGFGEEFPIFGPLISGTVGNILKPPRYRQDFPLLKAGIVDRGLSPTAAEDLGIMSLNASMAEVGDPNDIERRMHRLANIASEPAGVYKFALTFLGLDVEQDAELAESTAISSLTRSFYDLSLGGVLGQCFVAGTRVLTKNHGRVPIEEIQSGDVVLSKGGSWREVEYLHEMGTASDLYELRTSTVQVSMKVTGRHALPAIRNKNAKKGLRTTEDIEVRSLRRGDYLQVPLRPSMEDEVALDLSDYMTGSAATESWVYAKCSKETAQAFELLEAGECSTRAELRKHVPDKHGKEALNMLRKGVAPIRYKRRIPLDRDLGLLLGWYAAEGSSDEDGTIQLGLCNTEGICVEEIVMAADRCLDLRGAFRVSSAGGNGIRLRFNSVPFARLVSGLVGRTARYKVIPGQVLESPPHIKASFLQGILNGDGWYSGAKAGFTSVSEDLCRGVWELCAQLGIIGNMVVDYEEPGSGLYPQGTPRKACNRHYISWTGSNARRLAPIYQRGSIPEFSPRTTGKSFYHEGCVYVQIASITPLVGEEEVFDLTIHDDPYYVVEQVTVHNTEFIRRFLLSDRYRPHIERQKTNFIPNQMPGWMPGFLSTAPGGGDYFIDFTVGDPYTKVEEGEGRLPGRGYEALNELNSGIPGVYDMVDRFLILADVAPYSSATRIYSRMLDKINLDEETRAKVERARQQVQEITAPTSRFPRFGDRPEDMYEVPGLAGVRKVYDAITHDFLEELPYVGSKLAPFRNDVEEFRRQVVLGANFADWDDPYGAILLPIYRDISLANPALGAIKGAGLGALLSSAFGLSFVNPLVRTHATAGLINPLTVASGGAIGAAISVLGEGTDEGLEFAYTDRLTYLRNRVFEEAALDMGDRDMATDFRRQSRRTLIGASNRYNVLSALPNPTERRFFRLFMEAEEPLRSRILEVAPAHFSQAMQSVWESQYLSREQADQEALGMLRVAPIPAAGSPIWNPSVPNQAVRIKISENGLGGISDHLHKQVFYESQRIELRNRFPDLLDTSIPYEWPESYTTIRQLARHQMSRIRSAQQSIQADSYGGTPYRSGSRIYVTHDRREELLETSQRVFR